MKCIIVDDDDLSQLVVKQCVSRIDDLELVAVYNSAVEAIQGMKNHKVDLIFLDIEMPEMSGLEFIRSLTEIPQVIIISSKANYAAEAFDYNVTDYLVKPVNFDRFEQAVQKVRSIQENFKVGGVTPEAPSNGQAPLPSSFFIKVDSKYVKLDLVEILYIEAMADYVSIFTKEGKRYTILSTMKAIENKLSGRHFCRIHRSHIINLEQIKEIEENMVAIGENKKVLPISRSYKDNLFERLNML